MIRGEQFYDFDKNDFTEEEIQYIEARSHELVDDDPNFVTGVNAVDYDDARYVTINTQFPDVETFAEAGRIHDEKAHDFEDSIEYVDLRERVNRALGGTSLYGMPDKKPIEMIDSIAKNKVKNQEICRGHVRFMFFTNEKDDSFSADELDHVWACMQKRIESLAPYTRLKISQGEDYVSMRFAIESSYETHEENLDRLRSLLISSVGDTDLRIKVRHSYSGQGGAGSRYREDEFGYGVSNFDEYIESHKKSN